MNRIKAYQQQQEDDALKQRAANGDAAAQYELSIQCLRSNCAESFEWLQKAANQGHAEAQTSLGERYTNDQYFNLTGPNPSPDIPRDYTKAASWFLEAAVQGNPYAQRRLGDLHERGDGVPRSPEQAAAWYCHAAVQGDTTAQRLLGDLYYFGRGVPQNDTHAALWYRKAAEQGNLVAELSLGYLYRAGRGVPQDSTESYYWFERAHVSSKRIVPSVGLILSDFRVDVPVAGKGETIHLTSTEDRDEAASHLTPAELSHAKERVRKWFKGHPAKPQ